MSTVAADSQPVRFWPKLRRRLRLLWIAAAGYGLIVAYMMFMESKLIYYPSVYPDGDWQPAGIPFEDAYFKSEDGTSLHGWYVPHSNPVAVILVAHGNAGNLSDRAPQLQMLHDVCQASVMIFDYRGYGRSAGTPNEPGILADGRAARAWLAQRANIPEAEIVLLGTSLGGAVAVDLAAAKPARGLILESTFTSLPAAAAAHYPWLPVKLLMRTKLDSLSKIQKCNCPTLICHGDRDQVIPFSMGQALYEAAPGRKQFVRLHGADHNDALSGEYVTALKAFLQNLPKQG